MTRGDARHACRQDFPSVALGLGIPSEFLGIPVGFLQDLSAEILQKSCRISTGFFSPHTVAHGILVFFILDASARRDVMTRRRITRRVDASPPMTRRRVILGQQS